MPAQVPNTNNNPNLNAAEAATANNSIRNFLKGMTFPPVTAEDRAKMKAAIEAFKEQVKKAKTQSVKNARGGAGAPPALQIAAQQTKIGNQLPSIASYLPAGTNLATTSFADAIKSMENTVAQLDLLVKNPVGKGAGTGNNTQ